MRMFGWWWLACLAWVLGTSGWAAEVYRWVDADGGVHYTEQPPPGHEATRMHLRREPSTAAASPGAGAGAARQPENETGAAEPEKPAPTPEQLAQLREECAKARRNIEVLRTRPASRYEREDGSFQRYSDEERERMIAEAEAFIREHCN